jgi:hypothetical protein
MKNKIAIASAFLAASSFATAEIVINDFLSFEGFVDMSYSQYDAEIDDFADESENSFAIDQVEIDWLFDFDTVTAQIDLAYEGSDGDQDGSVEQAFATYHFDNGAALTAGRFASMLGFEAFEPTGLYQFSTAYSGGLALDEIADGFDLSVLPGYDQGVKFTYETNNSFFGISLVDGGYDGDRLGGDTDDDSGYGVEAAAAFTMDNGLSYFLGGRYDDGEESDNTVLNTYVTFETGAWLFAAELSYGEEDFDAADDVETYNALLMANFAYSDVASVTGRLSYVNQEVADEDADFLKYTLAHGYAFTDNLLLVTELSYIDGDADSVDFEELGAAVELLFSF